MVAELIPGKDGTALLTFSGFPPTPSSCWTVTGAGYQRSMGALVPG